MRRPSRFFVMRGGTLRASSMKALYPACFVAGAVLGHFLGALHSESVACELSGYLRRMLSDAGSRRQVPFATAAFSYFRAPVLVAAVGALGCGTYLLPVFFLLSGASLAYSVRAFCAALGRPGLLLAALTMGLRCAAVTLCCFFLAWQLSARRSASDPRRPSAGQPFVLSALLCAVVLLTCCIVDVSVSPRILQAVMHAILP